MPDSATVLVCARRERVEPLRPYLWDDPDNDYLRKTSAGCTMSSWRQCRRPKSWPTQRNSTAAVTLPVRMAESRRSLRSASGLRQKRADHLAAFRRWLNDPPKDWKPTPWFPVPWNRNQMEAFDKLPSLGYIHRPVFVKFEDEHGQPVKRRDARQKILEAGWQQALQTLPEAERAKGPSRIVGAFGEHVEQRIGLEGVLTLMPRRAAEIDTAKTAQFINTDRRLGNTGASTFFVQMALGVMGSYIAGGTSAAINLRDPAGASIVFISPPTEANRNKQKGWDVFKHRVQPAVNPENYKPPTVGAVLQTGDAPTARERRRLSTDQGEACAMSFGWATRPVTAGK